MVTRRKVNCCLWLLWISRIGVRKSMSLTEASLALSERARAAVEIGKLKRNTSMPIYEPDRERIVFANVQETNPGPLQGGTWSGFTNVLSM